MHNRYFRRVPFATQVTVSLDQETWAGEILDIALKGALVETETPLPLAPGTHCNLCITLPGTTITLDFEAVLIHHEGCHCGFKFISEDLDTLTHLRKLIELNTGDVETTSDELSGWLNT